MAMEKSQSGFSTPGVDPRASGLLSTLYHQAKVTCHMKLVFLEVAALLMRYYLEKYKDHNVSTKVTTKLVIQMILLFTTRLKSL